MAQTTLASATSLLKTALRQQYGLSVVVQSGSVQALRTAQLLWDDPSTPGNHSLFQYYAPTPGDTDDSASELAWHLTSTEGRGIEGTEIQKAMKLQPRSAGSVFGCSRQILHFGCVHRYLYEDGSPIHAALKSFAEWMLSAGAISILERLAARHHRFYERLLATLDIRVQGYISSCAYAATVDQLESSMINFEIIKQNLRLQNISDLAGTVFPEAPVPKAGRKRNSDFEPAGPSDKSKPVTNSNPHPSLALTSYQDWDKVRGCTHLIPKVDGVDICGRFHCRQACNTRCTNVHGRLSPASVKATETWIRESKARHARGEADRAG